MAFYPAYTQHYRDSSITRNAGIRSDRGGNNTLWIRLMAGTVVKPKFKIVHPDLTLAQWDALNAFYVANLASGFDFVFNLDGLTYTNCFFTDAPQILEYVAFKRVRVSSEFEQR